MLRRIAGGKVRTLAMSYQVVCSVVTDGLRAAMAAARPAMSAHGSCVCTRSTPRASCTSRGSPANTLRGCIPRSCTRANGSTLSPYASPPHKSATSFCAPSSASGPSTLARWRSAPPICIDSMT
jgi:hypothetical protein